MVFFGKIMVKNSLTKQPGRRKNSGFPEKTATFQKYGDEEI